jgi:hypothetical protein
VGSELEPELESQCDLFKGIARAPIDDLEPVTEALCELIAEVRVTGNPADRDIRVTHLHTPILPERLQGDTNGSLTISHITILNAINTIIDGVDGRVLVAALEGEVDELIDTLLSHLAVARTLTALPVGGHLVNLLRRNRILESSKDRIVERGNRVQGLRVHQLNARHRARWGHHKWRVRDAVVIAIEAVIIFNRGCHFVILVGY